MGKIKNTALERWLSKEQHVRALVETQSGSQSPYGQLMTAVPPAPRGAKTAGLGHLHSYAHYFSDTYNRKKQK